MKKIAWLNLWEEIRSSFWFIPALMAIAAIVLSYATVVIDQWVSLELIQQLGFLWTGNADGARSLLTTVAGSIITVAGVVFSLTIATYSQASMQFGPRLLRTFMRDRGNQVVLGTFISTFIYCLMVLRTVRTGEETGFVPNISITLGIGLALASLGVLIYFIHHVTASVQAPVFVAGAADDLLKTIERLFPAEMGQEPSGQQKQAGHRDIPKDFDRQAVTILASDDGYLEGLDNEGLIEIAQKNDLVLRIHRQPGHFVIAQTPLARLWPPERSSPELNDQIEQLFVLGKQETQSQDVEFAIGNLVDVAIRGLSPGTNDPLTAATCLDWLGAALCRLAGKPFPSPYRYDGAGHLRVIVDEPSTFAALVDVTFDQVRQYADSHILIRKRMLDIIGQVIPFTQNEQDRQALIRQARLIERSSHREIAEPEDQQVITARYRQILQHDGQRHLH